MYKCNFFGSEQMQRFLKKGHAEVRILGIFLPKHKPLIGWPSWLTNQRPSFWQEIALIMCPPCSFQKTVTLVVTLWKNMKLNFRYSGIFQKIALPINACIFEYRIMARRSRAIIKFFGLEGRRIFFIST